MEIIPHLNRLTKSFDLCEKIVQWVRSYLTGRIYGMNVVDALSNETRIHHGLVLVYQYPSGCQQCANAAFR